MGKENTNENEESTDVKTEAKNEESTEAKAVTQTPEPAGDEQHSDEKAAEDAKTEPHEYDATFSGIPVQRLRALLEAVGGPVSRILDSVSARAALAGDGDIGELIAKFTEQPPKQAPASALREAVKAADSATKPSINDALRALR